MAYSRALKFGLTLAAGLAVAGTAAGVTFAATTTSSKVVYACANRTGTLKLLSKGKCPVGYAKVAINKQGPRGLTGARGPQGPGAIELITTQTDAHGKESAPLGRTGLTASAVCLGNEPQVYVNQNQAGSAGAPAWTITGSSQLATGGTGDVLHEKLDKSGVLHDTPAAGGSLIDVSEPDDTGSVEFTTTGDGTWFLDLMVARNRHVFSLQADMHRSGSSCTTHVLVTPAT